MMIGLKSVAAIALAASLVAIAAARGTLAPSYLAALGGSSWFMIGLLATLLLGLVGVGWRFGVRSRGAIRFVDKRPTIVDDVDDLTGASATVPRRRNVPRELSFIAIAAPASGSWNMFELSCGMQRSLVLAGLVAVLLGAFSNRAAARIVNAPEEYKPSPSAFCPPNPAADPVQVVMRTARVADRLAAPAPTPQVDQAGCALVKRAYALGYSKSLGSCAPKTVAALLPSAKIEQAPVCERRHRDEPYLHFAYRRLGNQFGSVGSTSPSDAIAKRVADTRAHFDHAEDLLADVHHAVTGSPHASHHVFVNLPDPHPTTVHERFTGVPRCSTRFADLPLWPAWHAGDEALLFEHVVGQLLFATRFGTAASCSDYEIHWGAGADACAELAKDPVAFLKRRGALASVRAVLDRRKRDLAIADLDRQLGRTPPPPPPPANALVSLACFAIAPDAKPARGFTVAIDGETIAVREVRVAAIKPTGDGPIDVYLALASLLGGTAVPSVQPPEAVADHLFEPGTLSLAHLDAALDASPFDGARWPLDRPELVAIYPFEPHLHAFIEEFRRVYLAQRGRL
ncbi:MAG TPA: hypothetical protein VFQ65_31315 [Kofleriaceae bacterium]|nr:hypothetical protein [Kofleriaceae bacterium]